jgi:soluble lytic murein transglycosylase-like protein
MRIFQRAALGTIGLAFCLASLPSSFGQTVYSYVDENGVPNFTNIPPQGAVRDLKVRHPITASEPVRAPDREPGYEAIIRKYAGQFRLDPSLVRSMIETESAFDSRAVSPKGARGLMQLMPATALRVGVQNSFDPEQNIRGGMQHMRGLLDRFNNDLQLSLAAYNAGENLVQRIGRIPHIRETHNYVRKITKKYGKTHVDWVDLGSPRVPSTFGFVDQDGILHLTNIPQTNRPDTFRLAVSETSP